MITKPNTVLVASSVKTTAAALEVGALMLLNGQTGLPVTDAEDIRGIESLQFGVVKEAAVTTGATSGKHPAYIAKTKAFTRDELRNIVTSENTASTEDTFTVTFPGTVPTNLVEGDNLHIKLSFKVDGYSVQKAESYVFDLNAYTSTTTLAADIATRITNNPESWVNATSTGAVLTVVAKTAIDFQPNAKSINATSKFNQVEFDLASFKVNGTGYYYPFGTVAKTANANPGIGNPYVVRDQEKDAMGYLGAMFSPQFPNIQPASSVAATGGLVDDSVAYDCVSFTAELKYRAPDESYMKSTGVSAQLYFVDSDANLAAANTIVDAIKAWAGGYTAVTVEA